MLFNLNDIPMPDLSGKVVLITGASRGIGMVAAKLLVQQGAITYASVFRNVSAEAENQLAGAEIVQLDVTKQQDVDHVLAMIRNREGKLDALINNAGIILPIGHAETLFSDSISAAFEVNVIGLHRVTVAALPLLKKSAGVIINAGTGAATKPMEGWAAYCSSKAGARMMTQIFATELLESDLQFFFLGIPPTDTDMQFDIRQAALNPISKIPKEELVNPTVPASAMVWLCGADARKLDKQNQILLDVREEPFKSLMA
ncbi:MAG: SDR family oxidoreductase [Alphaproteobacteria bacterium]|nr:SDR family oxidoreductase [Alphaproteobacteria bacterium]